MQLVEKHAEPSTNEALEKILHAAEAEFADKGFDGAGMKALAMRAGVSQSLLHYHFGSKDNLYAAVIRARSRLINDERLARLASVDLSKPDATERVFEALFVPALGPAGGGRAYARIFAGLIAGSERDQGLVRECYDPTAKQFIQAIQASMPNMTGSKAALVYQYSLGVLASIISRDGRVERLAGDSQQPADKETLMRQLTIFVVGGARAIAQTN